MYTVDLWGSHPDEDNDDCWMGEEFATLEEAKAAFDDPTAWAGWAEWSTCQWIILDGPDIHLEKRNLKFKRSVDDGEWKREQAMQAGMAFGCDGYNDEMGY